MIHHFGAIEEQARRLAETGYTLTKDERDTLDRAHRRWAWLTCAVCFGLLGVLVFYPIVH